MEFVIALVPDPAHTHLSLFFDRAVEALELGVQGEGWEYDRTALPWDNVSYAESNDFRVRSKQSEWESCRERYPGVMVFRRTWEGDVDTGGPVSKRLLVFLVGETPTGGLHRTQFEKALEIVGEQRSRGVRVDAGVLRVVGPTFSGSLPSLASLLKEPAVNQGRPVRVRSGSVSSSSGIGHFRRSFAGTVDFRSAVATDDYLINELRNFVYPLGYRLRSIAILSEDETAYGTQSNLLTQLYYPRGISHIRSAYQKDELFESTDQRSRAQPRTTLRLNLADTGQDGDSVPPFSAQLPVSQETVLQVQEGCLAKENGVALQLCRFCR